MYFSNVIFKRILPIRRWARFKVSTGDVGPLIPTSKKIESAEVDVVNYGSSGLYFSAYSRHGFVLNSGIRIVGPCAAFPRNALCWNVRDFRDITEESLSLFFVLEPKLDLLLIGKGAADVQVEYLALRDICHRHNLAVEILPTHSAVGMFNFLISEGRYVAAGLIPPHRLDLHDHADMEAGRSLLEEEELSHSSNFLQERSVEEPVLLRDSSAEPPKLIRSPLLNPDSDNKSSDKQ